MESGEHMILKISKLEKEWDVLGMRHATVQKMKITSVKITI